MKNELSVRLAIRSEGDFLNAYVASADSMADAMLVGSIRKSLCERDDTIWQRWKSLMSDTLATVIADLTGQRPTMNERPAPEYERSGSA